MSSQNYIKIGKAADILGISSQGVRRWVDQGKLPFIKTPGGHRLVDITKLAIHKSTDYSEGGVPDKPKVFYCRVSSRNQKPDLDRQIELAKSRYPEHEIVSDIGSGINWKRKGLLSILERAMAREIEEVVVFHRDRLCRFGFELIEFILEHNKVKLLVSEEEDHKSPEVELASDLMSIIHVFSCRQMGKRRYRNKSLEESEDIPDSSSEGEDGLLLG